MWNNQASVSAALLLHVTRSVDSQKIKDHLTDIFPLLQPLFARADNTELVLVLPPQKLEEVRE